MKQKIIYPLVLLTIFNGMLLTGRVIVTQHVTFVFLTFNLLLAWVPVYFAHHIHRTSSKLQAFLLGVPWLLFFPNTVYLITDLIHLRQRSDAPLWFDSLLLFSFSLNGLLVGVQSLVAIRNKLSAHLQNIHVHLATFAICLLSGYGVYMGRFLRWNSWNAFTHPTGIFYDTAQRIMNPFQYPDTYVLSFLIACLLILATTFFHASEKN